MTDTIVLSVALLLVAGTASPEQGEATLAAVSVRTPITIDGSWAPSEWDSVGRAESDDFEVRASRYDGFLQIAVRASSLAVTSLCVLQRDTVHVFHASSALGHAVYVEVDEGWTLEHGFEWRLRSAELTPEANAQRQAHLESEGWVASTTHMGNPGEMEFTISPVFLTDNVLRLSFGLFLLEDGQAEVAGWPLGPGDDGSTLQSVIAGPLPDRAHFEPDRWAELRPD